MIIIAIFIAVIFLFICCFRYIKCKIISKTTNLITKTTGKYFDEKTAGKINHATSAAAETLKKGNVMKTVVRKGVEIAIKSSQKKEF